MKRLSPGTITIGSTRRSLSPRTPVKQKLSIDSAKNKREKFLSPFRVDTPNRKKIVMDGLQNRRPFILGTGAFGTVYMADYKGDKVATKLIDHKRHSNASVEAEKHAASLTHPNIVKVLAIEEGGTLSLITMEFCSSSLHERLLETTLSREERVFIWKGVARALRFCHNSGIVHADVKPKNILMGADGQPKLADFGSSIMIKEPCIRLALHGTPGYAAPEVVRGSVPTPAADIYSLGIVAWQMVSRKPPFPGLHGHTVLYLTGKGIRPSDENLDDGFNGEYKELYREMYAENERHRPALFVIIIELDKLIKRNK